MANGPAQKAGLQEGDIILGVNGQEVTSVDDLHRFLSEWPIHQPVTLSIFRGQERMELKITPTEVEPQS
jgi:S1-C subfamily serine protease